jgi:DNA (cytosine-5)-methyltransferase 1
LQHPTNPDLLRQFTPVEHARLKGIPEHLINGLGLTIAHELLGQSICYEPFRAVGRCIGKYLQSASGSLLSCIAKAMESAKLTGTLVPSPMPLFAD